MTTRHDKDMWIRIVSGPIAVAALAVLIEVLSQAGLTVPRVDAFLILLVAYVAFVEGVVAGVGGALVAVLYYAYASSPYGGAFHEPVHDWEPIVIVGVSMPALALIVGRLRSQLDATRTREEAARAKLDTVLEGLSAGFYTVDREGRIEYANRRAAERLGAERETLAGRKAWEVEPRLPGCEDGGGLERCLERRASESYELHDPAGDAWLDVQIHPMARGQGVAVYFADVTERRRSQARAHGAAKLEALGRLAGGIAHDFNNLLTAIRGFNDLVLRDLEPGDPRRVSLQQVARAADQATRMTHQILAYSRRQMLKPQVLDLNHQIAEALPMLHRLLREGVVVETDYDEALFPVQVDAGQFEQIVLNLALNGSDAMPEGGRLSIRTSRVALERARPRGRFVVEPGDYAVVTVEDTGVGMDAETVEWIFEPFFTTKHRADGTGLGLSTVYGIVKQSGGYILVDSEPGRGSKFEVWFPRAKAAIAAESGEPASAEPSARDATVLVVEDDEAVRSLGVTVLRSAGFCVIEARDGFEALSLAEGSIDAIDLVFTDIVMPRMSGRELVRHLTDLRPDLKVLYTSGYTNDDLIQGGIARGVLSPGVAFLHKPFTPDELLERVTSTLGELAVC